MLRIILIIGFFLAQNSFAQNQKKPPQTLDEINAELLAKKAALEPFNPKDVKVDLESLGLDDVDRKDKKIVESPMEKVESAEKEKALQALPKPFVPAAAPTPAPLPAALPAPVASVPAPAIKEQNLPEVKAPPATPVQTSEGVMAKIQKLISKNPPKVVPAVPAPAPAPTPTTKADIKKPAQNYINSKKKKNLKQRLEDEKKKKWDDKENEKKLKKLEALRKKYLQEAQPEHLDGDSNDEDFSEAPKLIPQKKDLNPYHSEELPALPILDRYRSKEDLHIPLVLTIKERIGLLFSTVSIGSVSAFNEAYKDIQNPNVQNESGDTILTYAIIMKKYPIIASVLGKGADPDMPNKMGYTPVHIAIELQDFKSFELLAQNRANLDYIDGFGRTYLMHASRVGMLPAVDLLLSTHGSDVNAMDNDGFTSLAIAYRHKQDLIVRYLLKHGAKTWIEKPYNSQQQSLILELEDRWKKQ